MFALGEVGAALLGAITAQQEQQQQLQQQAGTQSAPALCARGTLALLQWPLAVLPAAAALLTCRPAVQHGLTWLVLDGAAFAIYLLMQYVSDPSSLGAAATLKCFQAQAGPLACSLALSARLLPQPGTGHVIR